MPAHISDIRNHGGAEMRISLTPGHRDHTPYRRMLAVAASVSLSLSIASCNISAYGQEPALTSLSSQSVEDLKQGVSAQELRDASLTKLTTKQGNSSSAPTTTLAQPPRNRMRTSPGSSAEIPQPISSSGRCPLRHQPPTARCRTVSRIRNTDTTTQRASHMLAT